MWHEIRNSNAFVTGRCTNARSRSAFLMFKKLYYRLNGRYRRFAARHLARRMYRLPPGRPIISFTFDDFPRSALYEGGDILERHAVAGTYYASFGLMGQSTPTGSIFTGPDVHELLHRGHEIGCHTFAHCHAYETSAVEFEASIVRNTCALRELVPAARIESLSYPISCPRPGVKQAAARHFRCARAGGQKPNAEWMDLDNLQAFFLEQSRDRPEEIRAAIDLTCASGGWLIFATHDVCAEPTRFGCTPGLFKDTVAYAAQSGARLLSVGAALNAISAPNGHAV